MKIGKGEGVDPLIGVVELCIGFPRKSHDHIGTEGKHGNVLVELLQKVGQEGTMILPIHLLKDLILSALNRNMQVRADLCRTGEKGVEVCGEISRFHGSEPNPLRGFLLLQSVEEPYEREGGNEVKTVGAEMDAGEHHLLEPFPF
jgi:hypothetical protein